MVAIKVVKETPNFLSLFNQSPSLPIWPKNLARLLLASDPWNSALGHQHHYTISILSFSLNLYNTSVISYWCY